RYPEDEAEYAEILARHNAILGELPRPGAEVVLVTTGYSDSPEPTRSYRELAAIDPDGVPWRTVAMRRIDEWFDVPSIGTCLPASGSGSRASSTRSSGWSLMMRWPMCWLWPRIAGGCSTLTMAAWT